MHTFSCTNTHHDVTDLLNGGMAKNAKNMNTLTTELNFSMKNKKMLNLSLR